MKRNLGEERNSTSKFMPKLSVLIFLRNTCSAKKPQKFIFEKRTIQNHCKAYKDSEMIHTLEPLRIRGLLKYVAFAY